MNAATQTGSEAEDSAQDSVNDETDDGGDGDHHDRWDERGDYLDLFVQLALIDVRDQLHGAAKFSGLLPHGHHIDEKFREDFLLSEGDGERRAVNDGFADIDHPCADVFVAGHVLEQFERPEERHTVFHESAEGAGKLRVEAVSDDEAVERDPPCEVVPGTPPFRRSGKGLEDHHQGANGKDSGPPVGDDNVIGRDQHLRRWWERLAGALEEGRELRNHHRHEDDDKTEAGDDQHGGIDERLLDAVSQALHIGEMRDEALEDVAQGSAGLARGNEVDVKRRKDARIIAECLGETASVHQGLMQALRQAVQLGMLEAFLENAERFVECHARGQQMSQLLGEKVLMTVAQSLKRAGRD